MVRDVRPTKTAGYHGGGYHSGYAGGYNRGYYGGGYYGGYGLNSGFGVYPAYGYGLNSGYGYSSYGYYPRRVLPVRRFR